MFASRQRSSRGSRNFGGRDIRHGTSRSTKYYSRQSSERGGRPPRRTNSSVGRGREAEVRDSWN